MIGLPPNFQNPKSESIAATVHTIATNIYSNPDALSIPALQGSAKELPSDFYDPYPEYNSRKWMKKWKGTHAPCLGPRGVDVNVNPDDMVKAHRLKTKGGIHAPIDWSFPDSMQRRDL